MKIIGSLILLIGVSIILIAGIAALQIESDTANNHINESSASYDTLQTIEQGSNLGMSVAGYLPMILIMFLLIAIAIAAIGAVAILKQ